MGETNGKPVVYQRGFRKVSKPGGAEGKVSFMSVVRGWL